MKLNALFKSTHFRYENGLMAPPGKQFQKAKEILRKYLDDDSYATYLKGLIHAIPFIKKAANDYSVIHASELAGVHPYNPAIIMSKNPQFNSLNNEEAGLVMATIDKLADHYELTFQ